MTQASLITSDMQAAIGRESPPVTYELDRHACRLFARAVGYSDPIHFDEEAARAAGYRDIPAPPGFLGHPVYNPGRTAGPGYASLRFDTPLKRILNGGTDIEYLADVCAGDVLTATTRLADIKEREGNMGPMLITTTETTFRNQQGDVVAVQRGTLIQY
ncbi:MAG TPA: MaoC family dehydratase N-terminal domain-containing protein [Dehalococcoidia bacterium]|nr:MaoC family dehydratase N-terminal domain-containing protein [Dehalococcoidia bacterium]